jgi:hypothetical protein
MPAFGFEFSREEVEVKVPVVGAALLCVAGLVAYIVLSAPSSGVAGPPSGGVGSVSVVGGVQSRSTDPVRLPVIGQRPLVGITVPTTGDLDRFIAATGTTPDVVGVFEDWSLDRPLQRDIADTVAARGSRLVLTWEPWDSAAQSVSQPRYSLESIADGSHDRYIDVFARSVKAYPHEVVVRFMHEMNGFWYPWASGAEGNTPQEYVRAWRHVHERFARLGVSNVRWMWAPNAVYPGAGDLRRLYPGDAYVDRIGISAYNWGARRHDGVLTRWQGFESLFEPTIDRVRRFSDKPVWVAEVGSTSSGGSKAAWIGSMFADLRSSREIAGVIWFDIHDTNQNADWRIETESDAVRAWTRGFAARRWTDNQEGAAQWR